MRLGEDGEGIGDVPVMAGGEKGGSEGSWGWKGKEGGEGEGEGERAQGLARAGGLASKMDDGRMRSCAPPALPHSTREGVRCGRIIASGRAARG